MFMPGDGFNLGLHWVFEVQLRDLIKMRVVFNCREISRNFKLSWPKPSKNHCFHESVCIAYTNGPLGLEVT